MSSTDPQEPRRRVTIGEWVARGLAVLLLVPVRLLWEAVKLCGRAVVTACVYVLERLVEPVGRFLWYRLVRPLWLFVKDVLWGWALQHVLWGLVLTPLGALLMDWLLRPLRHAVERWLWRRLLRPALVLLWRRLLRPVLGAIAVIVEWLWRWCVEWPLRQVWRWVLRPCGLLVVAIVSYGWRGATAAVRVLIVVPCAFVYRTVLRPVLRALGTCWDFIVVRPIAFAHRRVVVPMHRIAADLLNTVFGR
ncbi:hypothetical protein [Nocardia jinanensis]|uniref:Uncharacterized protein n=1 Tax=Nocardia jinanensis TaxID=382504 RepID=A0A917RUM8_9NOCA|nr:hypothetical protein [Nocardia jinanensis]GGL32073.1 hypothetical protein GCM10011588_53630 [Nocardia jinanensis]